MHAFGDVNFEHIAMRDGERGEGGKRGKKRGKARQAQNAYNCKYCLTNLGGEKKVKEKKRQK